MVNPIDPKSWHYDFKVTLWVIDMIAILGFTLINFGTFWGIFYAALGIIGSLSFPLRSTDNQLVQRPDNKNRE
jgi:hypothetical protein